MIAEELRKRQKTGIRESPGRKGNEEMRQEKERGDGAGRITGRWRDEGGGRRERSGKRETRDRKGGGKRRRNEGRNEGIKRRTGAGKEERMDE